MKKLTSLLICVMLGIVAMSAQVRFSANADVYRQSNDQKVGTQYIAADIGPNGSGTMTIGSLTLKAVIASTKRDNIYDMTAYTVTLYSQGGKTVDAVITKRDDGTYTVLVYYGDGTLRYDL